MIGMIQLSLVVIGCVAVAQVSGRASLNPDQVVSYLEKYGYLESIDPRTGKLRSSDDLHIAVRKLQRLGGLKETGNLDDPALLKLVGTSRCGVPDFGPADKARRRKRYVLQGSRWSKKDLTYKIINYTPDLTHEEVDNTIRDAFNEWAKVSALTFRRVTSESEKADIRIKFVTGDHSDGYPFDGPGGTLAHAFYPHNNKHEIHGDAHFDDHETFTLKTDAGIDLFWVAVHEFGHSLGLDHSRQYKAIMYPFYRGYQANFRLHNDDIRGLQLLYGGPHTGSKTTVSPPDRVTPTPHRQTEAPGVPNKCTSSLDALIETADGLTYAFRKDHFWPVGGAGAWTSGLKIHKYWHLLEDNIDAGFMRRSDNTTFIFKGDKFWMFKNRTPLKYTSLPITDPELNLPAELANMDAALQWARNNKVYFFKGYKYWRYDSTRRVIDIGYPRLIADGWRGAVPDNIDAALQWTNGRSYFFKGTKYNAIDDLSIAVLQADPPYPRKISTYWMGCSPEGLIRGKISPIENTSNAFLPNLVVLICSIIFTKWIQI